MLQSHLFFEAAQIIENFCDPVQLPAHVRQLAAQAPLVVPLFGHSVEQPVTVNFLAFLFPVFKVRRRDSLFDTGLVADSLPHLAVFEITPEHPVEFAVFVRSFDSNLTVRVITVGYTFTNGSPFLDRVKA